MRTAGLRIVYRTEQAGLRRQVALKVLSPDMESPRPHRE